MLCEAIAQITRIIESDRRMIATCRALYVAVLIAAAGVGVYFHNYPIQVGGPLMQFSGAALFPIAAPLVAAHIRLEGSLRMLREKKYECRGLSPTHPRCAEIKKQVDEIMQNRTKIW